LADTYPVVTACSYALFHAPFFAMEHGTTPASERAANPESQFLAALPHSFRSFAQVCGYPPNQAFIGNVSPRKLPQRPWHTVPGAAAPDAARGSMGRIVGETTLYALMKLCDSFDLVALETGFRD
jgi:glycine/sarcosine/betaine reductase complex component C subunit beta